MNLDVTEAADLATALGTGQMIARLSTTSGIMTASEPETTTGLSPLQTHATDGLMLINVNIFEEE